MEPNITINPEPQIAVKTDNLASQGDALQNQPKKSLPKWPLVIVGVILLATLLTGTYLLGKNQSGNPKPASKTVQTATPTTTPTPIDSPKPTAQAVDPTANWKTYTNTESGFSFRYPASAIVEESPFNNGFSIEYRQNKNQGQPRMLIQIFNKDYALQQKLYNPDNLRVLTDSRKRENFAYSPVIQLAIANQTLYYYSEDFDTSSGTIPPPGGPNNASYVYGIVGSYFYDILYENDIIAFGGESNDFDRILSTFKFTQ